MEASLSSADRDHCGAMEKPSGVVAVTGGVATVADSVPGDVASVDVSPVVISDVVMGPGGAGSGWAVLVLLNATVRPPMARTAPAPMVADASLIRFDGISESLRSGLSDSAQEAR